LILRATVGRCRLERRAVGRSAPGLRQSALVKAMLAGLRWQPLVGRWATVGASLGFVVGAIVGLIVGLSVHAATAWFALFELGVPAGIAGGLVGLIRRPDRDGGSTGQAQPGAYRLTAH
jgi:hypothetical protein